MGLTQDNTAFFSTSDDKYLIYSVTSLLTIRDYLPDAKLNVISSGLSNASKKLLSKKNIDYIEVDLSDVFTIEWDYPKECYFIFSGPEIFHERGYEYSVYIDGDVLCAGNPLLIDLPHCANLASADQGIPYNTVFFADWPILKEYWKIPVELENMRRINSGVVYFDNESMAAFQLLSKAGDLFQLAIKNDVPRKGDDSLLALLAFVYYDDIHIHYLKKEYNYIESFNKHSMFAAPVFYHFAEHIKPWMKRKNERLINQGRFYKYARIWRSKFRNTAARRWMKMYLKEEGLLLNAYRRIKSNIARAKRIYKNELLACKGLKRHVWTRIRNSKQAPLKVYWWKTRPNFGDLITPDIIKSIFGFNCVWASVSSCELIGAGSVLSFITCEKSYVWGSGLMQEGVDFPNSLSYCAVRGELTRSRIGDKWRGIALGDPGLLANIVYKVTGEKTDEICVIPHYVDEDVCIISRMRDDSRFRVVYVDTPPQIIAEMISRCKLVLSSSLHGLIFADSFGTPNIHMKLSDRVVGNEYKFRDYYSAVGKEYIQAEFDKLMDDNYLEKIREGYVPINDLKNIQKALIAAFPF